MDKSIYVASVGAKQAMLAMQNNTQNLSNVNTVGFKSDLVRFKSFPVTGGELDTRSYSIADDGGFDMTNGTLRTTNRPLDIAIRNNGFFSIKTPEGEEAYTRMGDLQLALNGALTTSDGKAVLGNRGPITIPPNQRLEIASDGTISILPLGSTNNTMDVIDRIKLVNPPIKQLARSSDGLFHSPNGPLPADAKVQISSGALESSNVNSMEVLTKLIDLSRYYETQVKLMKVIETNAEKSASVIQF